MVHDTVRRPGGGEARPVSAAVSGAINDQRPISDAGPVIAATVADSLGLRSW